MRGKPISRILSRRLPPLDDHSSDRRVATVAIAANPNLLGQKRPCLHTRRSGDARSLFGIAPGGACLTSDVTTAVVGSYPTVSPFPATRAGGLFLWRFPSGCPARALPGTVSFRSPDFPLRVRAKPVPVSDHPAFRASGGVSLVAGGGQIDFSSPRGFLEPFGSRAWRCIRKRQQNLLGSTAPSPMVCGVNARWPTAFCHRSAQCSPRDAHTL